VPQAFKLVPVHRPLLENLRSGYGVAGQHPGGNVERLKTIAINWAYQPHDDPGETSHNDVARGHKR
jgi:hypothetical protein